MPTTTVTSTTTAGGTTTTTTTTTTEECAPSAPAPAAAAPILKDGVAINDSIYPKVGIPDDPDAVTAEWVTAALQSRGIISQGTTVTNVDAKQIGEGRGYANYTILAKLTYSRPQHEDVPKAICVKIANATFQQMILANQPELMWKFMNDFYVCESYFYTDYRQNLPCACCKHYWSEIEYPEDPGTQFGKYGLMIEYLGDDLKLHSIPEGGIPLADMIDAVQTVAKIHAASWNDSTLKDTSAGGTNFWMNHSTELGQLFQIFGASGWESFVAGLEPGDPSLAADCDAAYKNMDKWMHASVGGHAHRTLSSLDLRSENLIWRKTGPADDAYECVPIDHQAWWFAPPTRDIAMLLATSMQADDIQGEFMNCCKAYHAALLAEGVESYSWEMFQLDLGVSCWLPLVFGGTFQGTIDTMKAAVAEMSGDEPNFKEMETMLSNLIELQGVFVSKAITCIELLGDTAKEGLAFIKAC